MRTQKILLLVLLLAIAALCALGLRHMNGYWFFFELPDRSGWIGEGAERKYQDRHAAIVTDTLLEIDSETYYFDQDGTVFRGEIELDGFIYAFDEKTGVMRHGWHTEDGTRYYFDELGHKLLDREYQIEGRDYLFGKTGAEITGPVRIDGKDYYFEERDGKLRNGEKQVDGAWYFYTDDGSRFGTGWVTMIDGRTVYYDGEVGMLFGEQTIEGEPYFLNLSMGGRMTGTVYSGGSVYEIAENGVVTEKKRTPYWSGIDVSYHQGDSIDWKAVRESGVEFAVIRAGYIAAEERPVYVPDSYYARNVLEAQKQGISVGAYLYLYNFTEEGLREGLDAFASDTEANRIGLDLPVFLDIEDKQFFKPGSEALGGYAYRTGLARFGMEYLRTLGYDTGFYTFQTWANAEFDAEALYLEGYPFWLARWYANDADLDPATLAWNDTAQPSLWQFRATGSVPGIVKEVDRNYLYWGRMK